MQFNNELQRAFRVKELSKFTEMLAVHEADPNSYPDGFSETNFEIILKTPGSSDFIAKCIQYGGNFNVKHPFQKGSYHKYPLHNVIKSECIENLKAVEHLLISNKTLNEKNQSAYVNVKEMNGKNCLHLLAEKITNQNFDNVFPMMKILLSYGCNANSLDTQGKTAFSILVDKIENLENGSEILKFFRDHSSTKSEKSKLTETVLLSYLNPFEKEEKFEVCFLNLMDLLRNGDINKFENKFPQLKGSEHEEYRMNCEAFLQIAIELNYINIIDLIINSAASKNIYDLRIEEKETKVPLLFWAYNKANLEVFSIFLLHPQISLYYGSSTLLHYFFNKFKTSCENSKEFDDYDWTSEMTSNEKRCFDFLLQNLKCDREYLNKFDNDGYPALYYSVKYGIDYMTKRLLENGAYIGPVITNIRKSLLNDFLDNCITSNSKFHDDIEFKLNVDYKFLEPPPKNNKHDSNQIVINTQNLSVENLHSSEHKEQQEMYVPEMASLRKLVGNANLQRLIMHPVLASFVFLKWRKIRYLIHLNLMLTLLYIFSFIPFVLINEHRIKSGKDTANFIYKPLYIASFLSLAMLILREISQLILSPKRYILSRSNWIDMALILSSLAILLDFWSRKHQLRMLHTIIILLAMWEYFNLLGYLPFMSVSLHTKIFRKVFTTFFKSLAFYSVMIIGFALAFYTLQGNKFTRDLKDFSEKEQNNSKIDIPSIKSRSDRYNNFYTVGHSIVKSFVMMTGELDANSIQLEGFTYSALFLLFLFIVTIVLYNLLNALAVSDTQEIKTDAKLIDLQQRVRTMHQSEIAIFNGFVGEHFHTLGGYLKKFISMFPVDNGKIYLYPNKNRNINACCEYKLKLSDDILSDMCTLLLKKREEREAERKSKLKENTYEKLSCDVIKMNKVINDIQNRFLTSSH